MVDDGETLDREVDGNLMLRAWAVAHTVREKMCSS
jgi:hypothetical protein